MKSAVLDSCVLYSAALRDLFMYLAELFQPKWSNEIHDEWMRNVLKNRPDLLPTQLERTRDLMNKNGRDCLVPKYRKYIEDIALPDTGDRHVVAVAIASKAPTIVTFNLAHFPETALRPLGIEAVHPDDFAKQLFNESPEAFVALAARHRGSLRNPPKTVDEYVTDLAQLGLTKTAEILNFNANVI